MEEKANKRQAKKNMLWFGMISMTMTFAGLTSAYLISSNRKDWDLSFELPLEFSVSTILILLSSLTFYFGKKNILISKLKSLWFLGLTFGISVGFVFLQFKGFGVLIDKGYYFTGAESHVNSSFLYVLVVLHLLHLFFGIIFLSIVTFKVIKEKYNSTNILGASLVTIFWHFLGGLWLYLFLFISYI